MTWAAETHGLAKTFGRFGAVCELNLRVPAGCVFALLGASGVGKTTAIKLLLNLISPTRGSAIVPRGDEVFGQIAPILPVIRREYPT
jgi:ABC-2 type transport system ATP-binding protein